MGFSVVYGCGASADGLCSGKPYACADALGCVTVGNAESIRIGSLLTMSGPDSVYGMDAVRGVEIAVADKKQLSGHAIELVKADDLCTRGRRAGRCNASWPLTRSWSA